MKNPLRPFSWATAALLACLSLLSGCISSPLVPSALDRPAAPAPTLMAAVVPADGRSVELTFSEDVPGVTRAGWTFFADGQPLSPTGATGAGPSWSLTFAPRWVPKGAVVTCAFDASAAAVTGARAPVAGFAATAVANRSLVTREAIRAVEAGVVLSQHWGLNVFSDRHGVEWGDGTQDRETFDPDPARLNFAEQMKVAKSLGATAVLLTAKHHDGFCLWPTASPASAGYRVADTAWGAANPARVDLVKEFCEEARAAGLRVWLYFSVMDRYAARRGFAGTTKTAHAIAQITELVTRYGPIDVLTTDGWGWSANDSVDPTSYANPDFATVRAALAAASPHTALMENTQLDKANLTLAHTDIISYEHHYFPGHPLAGAKFPGTYWRTVLGRAAAGFPREANDHHGAVAGELWFYHPPGTFGRNPLESAAAWYADYLQCRARGTTFAPNVSPDRNGEIPADQRRLLEEIGALIRAKAAGPGFSP